MYQTGRRIVEQLAEPSKERFLKHQPTAQKTPQETNMSVCPTTFAMAENPKSYTVRESGRQIKKRVEGTFRQNFFDRSGLGDKCKEV